MEIIKNDVLKDKIFEPANEIDTYLSILTDYMNLHENILEMVHASLIVEKMQEQLDIIKGHIGMDID